MGFPILVRRHLYIESGPLRFLIMYTSPSVKWVSSKKSWPQGCLCFSVKIVKTELNMAEKYQIPCNAHSKLGLNDQLISFWCMFSNHWLNQDHVFASLNNMMKREIKVMFIYRLKKFVSKYKYSGAFSELHIITFINTFPYMEDILPKGPYLPCLSMADRALLAEYHRYDTRLIVLKDWDTISR